MKNKVLLLITTALVFSSLTGCKKEVNKIHLTYGTKMQVKLSNLKELTNDELLVKTRDEKEVFLLATYQGEYSKDCLCWATFKNVIVNYANKYNRIIYLYNAQNQDDSLENLKIEKLEQSTPYLYVFNGEEKLASFSYNNSKDRGMFEDIKGNMLKDKVDQVVDKPLMYYIYPEEVQHNTIKYHSSWIVLYIRRGCGDCKYVLPNIIIPYINSHNLDIGIQIVDLQDLYDLQKEEGT